MGIYCKIALKFSSSNVHLKYSYLCLCLFYVLCMSSYVSLFMYSGRHIITFRQHQPPRKSSIWFWSRLFEYWSQTASSVSDNIVVLVSILILLCKNSWTIWYSVTTIQVFKYYSEITNGPNTNSTILSQLFKV